MSASGQKRKSRPCGGMSASPPKADIGRTFPEVRFHAEKEAYAVPSKRWSISARNISRPAHARHVNVRKMRISDGSGIAFTFSSAAGADRANSITKRPDADRA